MKDKLSIFILTVMFATFVSLSYSDIKAIYFLKFKYKETQGKIISGEIKEVKQLEGEEFTKEVTAFMPIFKYEYEIDNNKYVGNHYRVSGLGESKSWAEYILRKFPPNSEAKIFYNPDNPKRSFLTKEIPNNYWRNLFGLSFILILIILFAFEILPISNENDKGKPYYEGFENLVKRTEY
jgi:hypothetical protein